MSTLNSYAELSTTTCQESQRNRKKKDESYVYNSVSSTAYSPSYLGGNQREIDRERAKKRAGQTGKKKEEGALTSQQKKERDAQIMREKQVKKEQQAAEAKK
jgi:hypothetical protein